MSKQLLQSELPDQLHNFSAPAAAEFMQKPLDLRLDRNLFNAPDMTEDFMSPVGYGSLMGMLKNYEAMNPFISPTTNSFKRLKPGYEAPVCVVTSLGHDPNPGGSCQGSDESYGNQVRAEITEPQEQYLSGNGYRIYGYA